MDIIDLNYGEENEYDISVLKEPILREDEKTEIIFIKNQRIRIIISLEILKISQ